MRKIIPTIICLDDEKYITDTLVAQLISTFENQFFYEPVDNVPEAWEVIDEIMSDDKSVALIISDWLMPKIKGDQFLLEVHAKYPQIKLILLSGLIEPEAQKRLEDANILHAMAKKPWEKADLMSTIKNCLNC